MNVPVWLWRLLHRPKLSNTMRLGPEDRLALMVADSCRIWSMQGRLSCIWWHTANEVGGAKAQARMALARALGMIAGTPDLVFIGRSMWTSLGHGEGGVNTHPALLIELKAGRGAQSPNQADFATWAGEHGINYRICRSLEEVETVLIQQGLLKKETAR